MTPSAEDRRRESRRLRRLALFFFLCAIPLLALGAYAATGANVNPGDGPAEQLADTIGGAAMGLLVGSMLLVGAWSCARGARRLDAASGDTGAPP